MVERRFRYLRPEQFLVFRIGELEEGQRAAVAQAEEAMAVGALGAEQFVDLTPGRDQGQPNHFLVEFACRLQVLGDVSGVVQPLRQFVRHVISSLSVTGVLSRRC
jgi:hypothetical protein